jgi:PAS domain S-box-containing protein
MAGLVPRTPTARWSPLAAAAAVADALLDRRDTGVSRRLSSRERRVELALVVGFAGTAGTMLFASTAPWRDPLSAALLVAAYALVARVRFELGPGLVRPTQLVFVPMLYLLPPLAVPALVAAGAILSELPEIALRRAPLERLLVAVADSWFAVGAAAVVSALAGSDASTATAGVYALALAAQFGVDFVASTLREWLGADIRPGELAPVLGLIYLVDALLTPIGALAVLASREHARAYLLAVAPGALLALVAAERRRRIDRELEQAAELQRAHQRLGEAIGSTLDRDALERVLLTAAVEAVHADCGRLGDQLVAGAPGSCGEALRVAETAARADWEGRQVAVGDVGALAVPLGARDQGRVLAVARAGAPFTVAERQLLAQLAAQAAASLENLRLHELMRETEAQLRAILEGVADSVVVEDGDGRLVYLNATAARELGRTPAEVAEVVAQLETPEGQPVPLERLPGRRVLAGAEPEPLLVRHRRPDTGEERFARVKASPVLDEHGRPRMAISVVEDITEIKQAEEAQRFLAESSRVLSGSLDVDETLPAVARLAVRTVADMCVMHVRGERGVDLAAVAHRDPAGQVVLEALLRESPPKPPAALHTGRAKLFPSVPDRLVTGDAPRRELLDSLGMVSAMVVPMRAHDQVVGTITLISAGSRRRFAEHDLALAEDLGLRAGATVYTARLYRTRSAIAQTLQASLLPPALPDIPGVSTAALYRPAGEGHDVGGDFYDVFSIAEDQWFVVVGDVCGKGAAAAAVTALARYTIRAGAVRHRSPAGVLRWLNDAMLRHRSGSDRFVTIACVRLDLDRDGILVTGASGGHPCPRVLRSTGLVEQVGEPGTLLGAVPEVRLTDGRTRLASGDALVLFTDGLTEVGEPRQPWTPAQLDSALAGARRRPAPEIVDHLAHAALDGAPQRDDVALVVLRAD